MIDQSNIPCPVSRLPGGDPALAAIDAVAVPIDIIFPAAIIAPPVAIALRRSGPDGGAAGGTDRRAFGNADAWDQGASDCTAGRAEAATAQGVPRRFARTTADADSCRKACRNQYHFTHDRLHNDLGFNDRATDWFYR
jgi:hypothetical protein